jgi:hypothetical protein
MAGYVYLVWAKGTDMYKIGSAGYPAKRLSQLQTGSPVELELVAEKEFEDHERQEKLMHEKWSKLRSHGEWFRFHPLQMPQVLAGFSLMDKWSHDRLAKEVAELQKSLDKCVEESRSTATQAVLDSLEESSKNALADCLPLAEGKAYESVMHLYSVLSRDLPPEKAKAILSRQVSFDQELAIICSNIQRP